MLKKVKGDNEEEAVTSENYLAFKKTLLLYDWIKGSKEIETKNIEQKYDIYRGAIYRLGERFSWLADSLAAIAESEGWKKGREEDFNTIISLSQRLIEGVKEEGLNLIRLYIPGLNRYYIGKLLGEGCKDENCLKELSKEQLIKVLPKRLVNRVQKRFALVLSSSSASAAKNNKPKTCNPKPETCKLSPTSYNLQTASVSSPPKTENYKPTFVTILEIDQHRPDRIIFEGEKIEVTSTEFSLIYLLAQNRGKILTHNDLLDTIWKESEDATYVQITYHLYKIRRVILKAIGNNKKNKEKVKDILKVISRRGIMLDLEEDKLKIN